MIQNKTTMQDDVEQRALLIQAAIDRATAAYEAMTPEQKEAHDKAQRESFVRGMMPTGDPRFD